MTAAGLQTSRRAATQMYQWVPSQSAVMTPVLPVHVTALSPKRFPRGQIRL